MAEGTLIVNSKKQIRIRFTNSKGKQVELAVPEAELSRSLKQETPEKLDGRTVELDEVGGQPKKVRPAGESFAAAPVQPPRPPAQQRGQQGRRPQEHRHPQQQPPAVRGAFHNPYNFVPALPRDRVTGELADHEPVGHHILHADRYTGVLRVKMTVKTPLLVPDAANPVDQPNDHKSFPVRTDAEGNPYIPPTSIKGMLRAAYEAITNSRLAVFPGHEDRLADRMPARDGLALVPARILDRTGNQEIELLPGASGIDRNGEPYVDRTVRPPQRDPMYAAWLPRYDGQSGQLAGFAVRYSDNYLPQHGDEVQVWLELWERTGRFPFRYWSVRKIARTGQTLGPAPAPGQRRGAHQPVLNANMISATGYVCITNRNIDRKHDERVFFTTRSEAVLHPLTDELRRQWRELITNYQSIHEQERRAGMQRPPALNNSVWSRHVVGGAEERHLVSATLCYAAFRDGQITALYPVMISRRLVECSPASLLPASLHPATALSQLSPADQVFGWVNQQGKGAYRGNLRIGPVSCETRNAIESFGQPGLPLAILGQPKPQQGRFYVAATSENGEAQANELTKEQAGYSPGKGLRGRKVYPHHAGLPNGHWHQPLTDRTQQADNGHFQEYRRPRLNGQEQCDNQNRSIEGWVKPDTEFTFDIHVTNLSQVELGALLWLLSLNDNHFHRFGGGKPLGFGSVRLQIASSSLYDGKGWKQVYSDLQDVTPGEADRDALIEAFKDAVRTTYGAEGSFENVTFIAAWLRMASGHPHSRPTHYPRTRQQGQADSVPPNPEGLAYEWFVANDRTGQDGGPQASLPDLAADEGLPMLGAPRRGN